MKEHLQAIVTVLSLVNPLVCGAMFARIESDRSHAEIRFSYQSGRPPLNFNPPFLLAEFSKSHQESLLGSKFYLFSTERCPINGSAATKAVLGVEFLIVARAVPPIIPETGMSTGHAVAS